MQQHSDTATGGRRGTLEVVASDRDRQKAFGRARRHTWFVRGLRLMLPAVALVSAGLYGAALVVSSKLKGRDIAVGRVTIDTNNLTMDDPRYEGFAKDGGQYKVHAKTAVSDLKMSGPVQLQTIDGQFIQTTGAVTNVTAKSGTYDQKKDLLELYERIDVDGSTGMKARLTRATINTKESRIVTNEPMYAETATGNIRANAMVFNSKTRQATFTDAVEVVLKPNPAAALKAGTDGKPTAKRESPLPGLQANSGEPVVVRSARLDVDDGAKSALFRENVVARQGEAVLEAPELDVLYEGKATADGTTAHAKPAGVDGAAEPAPPAQPVQDATRLKWIKARGGVVMTSKDDRVEAATFDYDATAEKVDLAGNVVMTQLPERRVTAETASLDQKADTALLIGDVVINQGRNVMRAGHVLIDRKAGTAKLRTPGVGKQPAGRISTLFYQNQAVAKPATSKPQTEAAEAVGPFGTAFKGDPDAPIEVEAATLDVFDRKHNAIYTGNVIAKQGEFIVRTESMTAFYTGETGLTAGAPATAAQPKPKAGATPGAGNAELKRIEARNGVVVTGRDGQQASGKWADFDVKANIVVMGGDVIVSRGEKPREQIVRAPDGMQLVIDLSTGVTEFKPEAGRAAAVAATTAASGGKTAPQVSGAFSTSVAPGADAKSANPTGCPPGAICRGNRLEAIFYPNQLKEQAKQKASTVDKATVDKATDAVSAAAAELRRKAAKVPVDGWSSSTSPREPGTR